MNELDTEQRGEKQRKRINRTFIYLFASTEQSELHVLISELESKITDLYIDSKASKQSSITDFFKKN